MAVTSFIPEVWSARLIHALDKSHVATNLVNRNYEGEIRQAGDTVHIHSLTNPTIRSYTAGTNITVEDLTTTDAALVINQAKYFAFAVQDADKVQAAGDLIDAAMSRAAYALADAADAYLLGVMASGAASGNIIGGTSAVALTASNVYEYIVKLRTVLDKANVPTEGRGVVVPPEVYALLLQDSRFTAAANVAESTLRAGEVGRVAGFTVYESNNCPVATVSSTSVTSIVATVATATTYAEQINNTEAMRQEGQFADLIRGLHLYGAKVTDANQVAVLKCTF